MLHHTPYGSVSPAACSPYLTRCDYCRWNARTIDIYWRNWNMPVHHWVTRHLCMLIICPSFNAVLTSIHASPALVLLYRQPLAADGGA